MYPNAAEEFLKPSNSAWESSPLAKPAKNSWPDHSDVRSHIRGQRLIAVAIDYKWETFFQLECTNIMTHRL